MTGRIFVTLRRQDPPRYVNTRALWDRGYVGRRDPWTGFFSNVLVHDAQVRHRGRDIPVARELVDEK
jgi:hypothetical protein